MLGVLTQDQLAHSLFPLGDTAKPQVRAEAAARGLLVADKPDSHDICFVADGDNAGWLREKLGDRAPNHDGAIVDGESGAELGRHDGTFGFTIGQRRGLRLGVPAPDGKPRYVLDIEPVSGTVTVGPRDALTVDRITADRPRWCGAAPTEPVDGTVQLRAHGREHRARVVVSPARPAKNASRSSCSTRPRGSRPARPRCSTTAPGSSGPPRSSRPRGPAYRRERRDAASGRGPATTPSPSPRRVRVVLGEAPDLPYLPELPARGAEASMIGRTLAWSPTSGSTCSRPAGG